MNHSRIASLAFLAATLAASGCGSSSGSPSLSKVQLIAKANPICAHANAALRPVYKITKFPDIPPAAAKAAGEIRQASTELAGLKPPASMEKDWKVIVSGYQGLATYISELGEHAKLTTKPDIPVIAQLSEGQHVRAVAAVRMGFINTGGCREY